MISEPQKRAFVSDLYAGKNWKRRVDHMSTEQVTAIYLKHNQPDEPVKPEPVPEVTAPPLLQHGPHQNEDDFPIY